VFFSGRLALGNRASGVSNGKTVKQKGPNVSSASLNVPALDRALSVRQLARRWAVSPKKIRAMLKRGIIRGFDVGFGRTQIRIPPEAVLEAEQQRLAVRPPTPRRKRQAEVDPEIARLLED
jgi:hypothetical protein